VLPPVLCVPSLLAGLRGRPADAAAVSAPLFFCGGGGGAGFLFLLKARVAPLRAAAASEEPVVWAATGVITFKTTSDGLRNAI